MADLKPNEIEDLKITISVVASEPGKMDAYYLADVLRCFDLNPSLDILEKHGWQPKQDVKFLTVEEVLPIYSDLRKMKKDFGCYEDFLECLKLYDKEENGKMLLSDLSHSLLSLGEKLTDAQVDELFEDCLPPEDDDGFIEYDTFLKRMCGKEPIPQKEAK